jgi:iron complex transport system permease protein
MINQPLKRLLFFVLPFLLVLLFLANVGYGAVHIPFIDVFKILIGKADELPHSWEVIVWQFRIPKAIVAILAGAGLAVSGLQMQTLFRNPLADAYTLGISSGASLGVALLILGGVSFVSVTGQWAVILAAVVGSLGIIFIVLMIAGRVKNIVSVLIIGMMLGNGTGALIMILQSFSGKEELQRYVNWGYGTLGAVDWAKMQVFFPVALAGILLSLFLHKPLNILLLGENYAQSMGLHLRKTRLLLILINSIIIGSITAFCGIIGFVGIAVPHICRQLFSTSNHKILLPICALVGSLFMLLCDMLCQLPNSPQVLPINAITALIGVPVVIWVMAKGS